LVSMRLLIARTLTPTHFGIGRAPGAVDLPIARDSMGYPIMPASSIKGALKRRCGVVSDCITETRNGSKLLCSCKERDESSCDDKRECPTCCCLFGGESGDKGASALSILDLLLFAVPAPSRTHGWVYVTSEYLMRRLIDIVINLRGGRAEKAEKAFNEPRFLPVFFIKNGREDKKVGVSVFDKNYEDVNTDAPDKLGSLEEVVNGLGGLAGELPNRLLVLPDNEAVQVINRSVIRYWRVRLDYEKKVVTAGPWSEEYVPPDAVFVGAVVDTGWRNEFCYEGVHDAVERLEGVLSEEFTAVLGGKESVGKGLVKLFLR